MSFPLIYWDARNILTAAGQMCVFAFAASILPYIFRLQHPKTLLIYNRMVLVLCFLLPVLQQWKDAERSVWKFSFEPVLPVGILAAGIAMRLAWLLVGLWRVNRYRSHSIPLYPSPETITAAEVLTNANATYCVSTDPQGPVTFGWLFPVIVLPEKFLTLPEEAQCGIACHELLHVRRRDWLSSMLEEFAGSLQWFNPGAWVLLAQARLAREQVVDQEAVRLTASREPYVEALLTFAKSGHSDPMPAPSFMRRNHLTQRMHFLLQEPSMPALRLVASYASMAVLLGATAWFTTTSMPLLGQPRVVNTEAPGIDAGPVQQAAAQAPVASRRAGTSAPVPPAEAVRPPSFTQDPVNVTPVLVSTPEDRAAAITLLETTKQLAKLHMPDTPSWEFSVPFRAYAGTNSHVKYSGDGELTETWFNGQSWRWTARLGDYSVSQYSSGRGPVNREGVVFVPLRAMALRSEIFWALEPTNSSARIRTAAVQWNGMALSCLLFAPGVGEITGARAWEEEEFCIDPVKKVLQIHSFVPGSYTVFSYALGRSLGGRPEPDAIQMYEGGTLVVDSRVDLHDLRGVDASTIAAPADALYPGVRWTRAMRRNTIQLGQIEGRAIIHAALGSGGALEWDLSAASSDEAGRAAMELAGNQAFGRVVNAAQTNAYIDVRFVKQ